MRRVFFLVVAALLLPAATWAQTSAPARPAPKYLGGGKPDQAEGGRVLDSFRNVGIQGDYWLKFDLRVMPQRGQERVVRGEMFGTQGPNGPLTRVVTVDPANEGASNRQLYLLHGGPSPQAWAWNYGQRGETPRSVEPDQMFVGIVDTDVTVFDLQMPFLQWRDFVYEGVANVRGRPAHAFLLYPPAPLQASWRDERVPAAVRVFLDTQFSAMTQAEWVGADGKAIKTVTVLDLKKVGDQWIVKSIDLRNHATRQKTRLAATAVALGLEWPDFLFVPEEIAQPEPEVPAAKISRL